MKAFLAVFFFSHFAMAHIEVGTWVGTTEAGEACQMVVGEQYFEGGQPHPLTERIPVEINSVKFVVGHPAIIDARTSTAAFNHDVFQGIAPIFSPRGAYAVEIEMAHTEGSEGPQAFTFITHEYKTDTRKAQVCKNLKLSI